jgi:hypothetical protein
MSSPARCGASDRPGVTSSLSIPQEAPIRNRRPSPGPARDPRGRDPAVIAGRAGGGRSGRRTEPPPTADRIGFSVGGAPSPDRSRLVRSVRIGRRAGEPDRRVRPGRSAPRRGVRAGWSAAGRDRERCRCRALGHGPDPWFRPTYACINHVADRHGIASTGPSMSPVHQIIPIALRACSGHSGIGLPFARHLIAFPL